MSSSLFSDRAAAILDDRLLRWSKVWFQGKIVLQLITVAGLLVNHIKIKAYQQMKMFAFLALLGGGSCGCGGAGGGGDCGNSTSSSSCGGGDGGGGGVAGLLSGVGDTTLMAGETAIFFLGVQNSMGRQTLQLWLC